MKALTAEWIDKAEGDWASAGRELRARKAPNYDAACFHAQQCVEKYMKSLLAESGVAFPRTHDLEKLLDLIAPVSPLLDPFRSRCVRLSEFAVEFRYPGEKADRAQARTAVKDASVMRNELRAYWGLRD